MKKRSFFLIEVLIGMVILALSLPLFVRQPIYFLQTEIKNLQVIEYERIKDLSLLEIRKILYEKPSLVKKIDPQKQHPLPSIDLFEGSSFHRTVSRYFFLSFQPSKNEVSKNDALKTAFENNNSPQDSQKPENKNPKHKLLKINLVLEDPLMKKAKEKHKKYEFFLFVEQTDGKA